jgi:hypothetical protein
MFAVLVLPGAHGATGDSTKTISDPAGDTVDERTNAAMTEPHGDAVEAVVEYAADGITMKLKVADPVRPREDNDWQFQQTGIAWKIDIDGQSFEQHEFGIEYGLHNGKIYADVLRRGAQEPVCQAAADYADQYYRIVLDRNCIDSPDKIFVRAELVYAHSDEATEPQSLDTVPDVSFAGPIVFPTDPAPGGGPDPAPGGGTPDPGNGGANPGPTTAPPPGQGYWLVARDGGIFTYGQSAFKGSTGNLKLNQPIVGMTARPDGAGYWFVAADGGIFAFGDVGFYGSTGAIRLNRPIVGMAATPTGKGYWLVANDGGIFAFGDAGFFGSTGAMKLNRPIVGMAPNATGKGYWFVADDGGVFAFGDAKFYGAGANIVGAPVVGISATRTGDGYRLVRSDGSVNFYGAAQNKGSMAGKALAQPIVGMAAQ